MSSMPIRALVLLVLCCVLSAILITVNAPGAYGETSCPNDALRLHNPMVGVIDYSSANLPDCRAYEQASPVLKNAADATGMVSWVKASPSGDAISFLTTSGIPGADGLPEELPFWLSSRNGGAWSTQGLYAHASAGQEVKVRGWTPDFSQVFQHARRLGPPKEAAFLARDSSDGSLEEVFPYLPTTGDFPSFAGSSPDGSVVVFESLAKLTPEAIERQLNVYAWERATGNIRLASVLPGCSPVPCSAPQGAFAGPYSWMEISTPAIEGDSVLFKGGAQNNHYLQDLHAVSADGQDVYFTAAGTGQLYLRLNATKEQSPLNGEGKCTDPAKACTIHVSASQKTNGDGPGGTDAVGPRPAVFMAASKDGSITYFTSPEKLTNDANTGPEPQAPSLARADINGAPASVKPDLLFEKARGVAVNATHIYWANPADDAIGRAKLNGSGALSDIEKDFIEVPEIEIETEPGDTEPFEANPQYVALGPEHVYWSNATNGKDGNGTIGRAKLGASGAEDIDAEYVTGAHNPQGIAINATHLFWSNAGSELLTRTIGRAKLGLSEGEEVEQVFIQVDQGAQQWTPHGLASNATHIYIAVDGVGGNSYVFRYNSNGDVDSQRLLFDDEHLNLTGVRGAVLDANFVYWSRQGRDTIGRMKLADFELAPSDRKPEREWIKDAGNPYGLAVDATYVYWSARQEVSPNPGNDLYRFDASNGKLSDLTPLAGGNGAGVKGVLGASEDGSHVYFAANGVMASGASTGDCEGSAIASSLNFSGQCNLYLAREGQPLTFVTQLDASGTDDKSDAINWLPKAGASDAFHKTSRVSADGQALLFRSQQQLTAYDNEGFPQLYWFKVGKGITCVSCNPTDASPSSSPLLGSIGPAFLVPKDTASLLSRNLSADGNRVFFETTDALVPADTNGEARCPMVGSERYVSPTCQDVYEWEAEGTGSCQSVAHGGGCLYLLSSGQSPRASFFGDASTNGDHAFLFTRAKLVGQDQDQLYDVYDASVNGGLISQNQPSPPRCTGIDDCLGPVPSPPIFESPTTDIKPRCPKSKRKVRIKGKVRCIPRKKPSRKAKGRRSVRR